MKAVVVIPVHNEAPTLRKLVDGIRAHIGFEDYQILFIDDGSTDASLAEIRALHGEDPRINYLRFSRNAGKTQALAAAFRRINADLVITMDADLQDDPAELPRMLAAVRDGVDMVCGWKQNRQDPWHKTAPSRVFNSAMASVFGLPLHDINSGFKVMRGEVARRLPMDEGMHRFIPVMAKQLGYHVIEIPVKHHPRRFGKSKYGFSRNYEGARDALWLWSHPANARHGVMPEESAGLVVEEQP
jgi:glycosyltransferase involved in cell wall biosynthesis